MKTLRFVVVLGCCLLGGRAARAVPDPKGTIVSASPDSALVHLTAAQVGAEAMQRLGGPVRWRYRPGQPPGWASPATNDLSWLLAATGFMMGEGPPGWRGTGCFRLRFTLDSALLSQPLALQILQEGASEIYLDGRLLGRYGTIGTSARTTRGVGPRYLLLPFMLREAGPHLLAVRYAKFDAWPPPYGGIAIWVAPAGSLLVRKINLVRFDTLNLVLVAGTGVLALLHFFLFLFYRPQRTNLYYSLYMGVAAGTGLLAYLRTAVMDEGLRWWAHLGFQAGAGAGIVLLLAFIYSVCLTRLPRRWLGLLALMGAAQFALWLVRPADGTPARVLSLMYLLVMLDMLRVLGRAVWRRQPGIWLVALGAVTNVLVYFFAAGDMFTVWGNQSYMPQQFALQFGFLLLPICTSVYLAREFATTRRHLEVQLQQVEQLSAQTLAQETERRRLVSAQNERLEATVQARTEEISQQNQVLARQRDEITAQADQLRALDQLKTRFFTNLTHEFRTPLTLMLGPAGQIIDQTREPATRQQAEQVQRNARRLLTLINQLLDLSRLEAGQQALHPAPADAVGFVRGLVGAFESLAQQRGIACSFEADRPALPVEFDPDKLEKVVVNLLSNAFKFTPSAGQVAVRLRVLDAAEAPPRPPAPGAPPPDGGAPLWLELTVADTGRGIGPAQLPHVFDRFYQADASDTREQEGTGIGLALTRELVELHGGTIALASAPGCGTTATVRLPLWPAATGAVGALPAPAWAAWAAELPPETPAEAVDLPLAEYGEPAAAPAAPDAAPAERPLVLVIDDNADMRAYLRAALAADYRLLEAADGWAGVAVAQEHLPDLVLTDAMMPRLDGYGVCQQLKLDERTSHVPVVMLTAKADLPSRLQGLDTGADAYLTKPFDRNELLAQLRNLVRGRQQLHAAYRRTLLAEAPEPAAAALPAREHAFLARVRAAVEQHLENEALDVELLAGELALSRTQLHRKLKALTGQAPGDFVRTVRLHRAHALLLDGALTVAEVAYQVGYGNPASFSTSFSRHFGYAPSEARRRAAALRAV